MTQPDDVPALDFLRVAHAGRKQLAIVSNNSAEAVRVFLELHSRAGEVDAIEGRPYARPDLMKPHPYLLERALSALGAKPEDAVLIGDSVSDSEAAQAIGAESIGFTNREGKTTSPARWPHWTIFKSWVCRSDMARLCLATSPTSPRSR